MIPVIADEDVPKPVIEKLRDRDLDIFSVDEEMKNATDREVLSRAREEGRVLLTFDEDYRELARRDGHPGILLVQRRTRHDRVVESLYQDYLQHLSIEDMENTLVNVTIE